MKLRISLLIIILTAFLGMVFSVTGYYVMAQEMTNAASKEPPMRSAKNKLPFQPGEKLVYDVCFKDLKVGTSFLIFHGEKEIEGKRVYHITFNTDLPTFKDAEEIYADKGTFLPVRVDRKIEQLGDLPMKAEERYDQDTCSIKVRQRRFLSKEFVIQKDRPICNALLLTYYYRAKDVISKKDVYFATLPTSEFTIYLKEKKTVDTKLGKRPAYIFVSSPPKFTFWLSDDEKKIPLRIKSHTMMDYSWVIRSVEHVEN